jgi:predicted O-methyltransferase YrrM
MEKEIYVSLTTIFQRQKQCARAIESIFQQSFQPTKVFLFVSSKPYLLDKGIRQFCLHPSLTELTLKYKNLEVNWVENEGPYRKLLPLLKKFWKRDNVLIVTVDDDVVYKKEFLETAVKLWKEKQCCIGFEGTCIDSALNYNLFHDAKGTEYLWNMPKGVGGVLYDCSWFPNDAIFNWKEFPYTDDLWFTSWRIAASIPCYIHTESSIQRSMTATNQETLWGKFNSTKNSDALEKILHWFVYRGFLENQDSFFQANSQLLFKWNRFIQTQMIPHFPKESLEGSIWNKHLQNEPNISLLEKQKNLLWIAKYLSGTRVCEVGFNGGFSALLWLLGNSSIQLDCLDLGEHLYTQIAFEKLKETFGDRITLQLGDSQITMKNLEYGYDLVHVDGGHSEAIAKSDCKEAIRILKPGGLLLLDDINLSEVRDGVRPFLNELEEVSLPFSSTLYKHSLFKKKILD